MIWDFIYFIKTHPTLICTLLITLTWMLLLIFYKPNKINWSILIFFIAYLFTIIRKINVRCLPNYMLPNWLINYRGGFIRRGLGGEIILRFSNIFGISPIATIYVASLIFYAILISFFVIQFLRNKYPVFILTLPFFLGETVFIDPSQWLRKDSLCLLVFITLLYIFKKFCISFRSFFLLNMVFIFGILIHEVVFFFAFPILFLSFYYKRPSISKNLLFFSPSIATFVFCFILSKYANVDEMIRLTPEIIDGLLFEENSLTHLQMNTVMYFNRFIERISNHGILFHIVYISVCITAIFIVCTKFEKMAILTKHTTIDNDFLSKILIFQFLSIFPLFCISWDWGRWMFLWVASSFIYFLIMEKTPFKQIRLPNLNLEKTTLFKYLDKKPNIIFLLAIFINCQFIVPFEIDVLSNTPAYLVFSELSPAVMTIKSYLIAFLYCLKS